MTTTSVETTAAPKKAAPKKKKTAIVKKGATALATIDYGEDAGGGYDPDATNDIQIPRINLLQALSEACQPGGMEGAKAGLMRNTATNELLEHLDFLVAKTEKCYIEWTPRDKGGGFVKRYEIGDEFVKRAREATPRGKITLDNENELIETLLMYACLLDDKMQPTGAFAVIDFFSTKLSAWRQWNTSVQTFMIPQPDGRKVRPPLFAHAVRMTTKSQTHAKNTTFNYLLSPLKKNLLTSLVLPDSAAFAAVKNLREMVDSGIAKANMDGPRDDGGEQRPDNDGPAPF